MGTDFIRRESDFFEKSKAAWIATYEGKFALVADDSLIGVYDDEKKAISEGYSKRGLRSFLVKRIQKTETIATFPALSIGAMSGRL